jgi:hypothetical protein
VKRDHAHYEIRYRTEGNQKSSCPKAVKISEVNPKGNEQTDCAEKLKLYETLAKAIAASSTAGNAEAKMKAHSVEEAAQAAVDAHRKKHGC